MRNPILDAQAERQQRRDDFEREEFSPAMRHALRDLRKDIAAGGEFPDACWRVCKKHGFLVDEVRRAYDLVEAA